MRYFCISGPWAQPFLRDMPVVDASMHADVHVDDYYKVGGLMVERQMACFDMCRWGRFVFYGISAARCTGYLGWPSIVAFLLLFLVFF